MPPCCPIKGELLKLFVASALFVWLSPVFNTVTLSADEEISVDYNLSGRSVKYIEVPDTNAIVAPGEALPTITTAAPADRNYVQHVVTVDRLDGEPTTLTLKFEANYV